MALFRRIVVPVDFSEPSDHALRVALDLARALQAELTVLHVLEVPMYPYSGLGVAPVDLLTPAVEPAEQSLKALMATIPPPGAGSVLRIGTPVEQILAVAKESQADLIVMGTHGRRGVAHLFMGSVAERVVRTSPVPVLTVRGTP
jgi:nucleotide-binding universal stress UspA family protein